MQTAKLKSIVYSSYCSIQTKYPKTVYYTEYPHSTCLSDTILKLFPTKSTSCMTCFRQSCEQCHGNQCLSVSPIQYSLQTKKWVSTVTCSSGEVFLTIFSLENERLPVQFVGIMVKYIRNAISMFGNVDSRPSALIRLYSSDIVGCGTSFWCQQ